MTELTASPSVWRDFLAQQGARFDADGTEVLGFGPATPSPQSLESLKNWMAPLTDLGLIAASGEEAASFLHGQLTNDVQILDENSARLAGYCTASSPMMCKSSTRTVRAWPAIARPRAGCWPRS